MLKLKNYSFSGIGRFVEKQTVDLESRDHLIQIDGENMNTGGSSGAGKSTTVEALAYLLGISEIPSTQLQSRITKSPIWVEGEFEGGITITRSKKDGLTVKSPEGTVSGNSKLAEERLDEIIGVNRNLLKTMCYKRQKQGGFFLNLTPKQSHEFLVECLDLKEFQKKIYKLEDVMKNEYKPEKIKLESSTNVLAENIRQWDSLLAGKEPPVEPVLNEVNEGEILVAQQGLELEKSSFQTKLAGLGPKPEKPELAVFEKEEDLTVAVSDIEVLKTVMHTNLTKKEKDIEQNTQALYTIQKKIDEANAIKLKMIENQQQIEKLVEAHNHLKDGNCPTCKRAWETSWKVDEYAKQIQNKESLQGQYREEVEKIPHYKMIKEKASAMLEKKKAVKVNADEEVQLNTLQTKVASLLAERQGLNSTIQEEYLTNLNEWNQSFNLFSTISANAQEEFKKTIAELEQTKKDNETKKEHYHTMLQTYNNDIKNLQDKRSDTVTRRLAEQTVLDKLERDIVLAEESVRLIKNFTLQKFQDTLNYIGERATEIINRIPNMANAVIFFENAKETKTGKIKNEVNAVMNLEGDSNVHIKTLSGGERTSADFAIDLAVGEMIESMTQKGVNFLIVDEGFDGLDSISKIECLEILKTLNTDKKILMVDHSSEVKEMVYDIIKVKRINEESFIQ